MIKSKKFFLVGILALVTSVGYAKSELLEPNSLAQVADDHNSVKATLVNPYPVDLFCDSVELDIVLAGRDYNDFSAHAKFHSQPVYFTRYSTIDLSEMGSAKALSANGILGIVTATIGTKSCRLATFADYCGYAPKSADEVYTVTQVLRAARRDCPDAEEGVAKSLDLSNRNIRTLQPISFLKNIETLNVEKNHIDDLDPVRTLGKLKLLVVNQNPIKDLSPALRLASIEKIKANGTLVEALSDPGSAVHRNKITVELNNTPYKIRKK